MVYVRVVVNLPSVRGEFDYHLGPELEGRVVVGHLVTVPFGKQTVQGVVLVFVPTPAVAETKPVLELLDPDPVINPAQIELAKVLSEKYLASLAACVDLMLPPGLGQQADTLYELRSERPHADDGHVGAVQTRILKLLIERGPLRGRQIDRHFKNIDWRKTAQSLVRGGLLSSRSVLPTPSVRPKKVRMAQLTVPPEQAEAAMPELGKTASSLQRRQSILRLLMRESGEVNLAWIYAETGCNLNDLHELANRGLISLHESQVWRDPLENAGRLDTLPAAKEPPILTSDQQKAWNAISTAFRDQAAGKIVRPLLLFGVTGSGKTELYIRAAEETIRRGRQAVILIPEISLTPQTVRRFLVRFPGQVGLIHSRLSEGERYDTWRRARAGLINVVVGPRSALFAPLQNIGLIVVDECHDGSFYQSEPPFYHAVDAARHHAQLCAAVCILGSATPSVVQQFQAQFGDLVRLELPERIARSDSAQPITGLPSVSVVDMREELKSGNRGIFSRELLNALEGTLEKGHQAILFLNRRGSATYVFCRECGYVLKCPQCETPMTLHLQTTDSPGGQMLCHRCGHQRRRPATCPNCRSTMIREYGLGSEKVETEVHALFPQARTLRWDWETTRKKGSHETILSLFASQGADVLIGTQMLAKGLDLPMVTLVGIVLADVGLNLPDPFAAERVFQVLTHVAGRAGRSALGGRVVLQTFQPEHYAIQHASKHDCAGFFTRELEERRKLGYPPFAQLIRLETRNLEAGKAEAEARSMAEKIRLWLDADDRRQTTLIGPAPCFFHRVGGWYRWQVILRGPQPASLLRGKNLGSWRVEVDPVSLL